ncbi:MAG: type VI secretion system baseplate subunit TssG [Pseudomonadota bacterium]
MADTARQAQSDLKLDPGLGFFEILSRFETDQQFFGRLGGPDREPARLGQNVRMKFATTDVTRVDPHDDSRAPRIQVDLIGLLGPEGPMPYHLTRWIYDRLSDRWFRSDAEDAQSDTAFMDFCDVLQHRMIALFYRAWADSRPSIQIERKAGGRIHAMAAAMSGLFLPTVGTIDQERDAVAMRQAGSLGHQVHGPERLVGFLSECLKVPVQVEEFAASWMEIPTEIQTRLGKRHSRLAETATVGKRVFDRQGAIEIRLGPLSFDEYQDFLPGGEKRAALQRALDFALSREVTATLRFVLKKQDVPRARIGACAVGHTAWLSPKDDRRANDYAFRYRAGSNVQEAA